MSPIHTFPISVASNLNRSVLPRSNLFFVLSELLRLSVPVSPFAPNSLTDTLASVPPPNTSPVFTDTWYEVAVTEQQNVHAISFDNHIFSVFSLLTHLGCIFYCFIAIARLPKLPGSVRNCCLSCSPKPVDLMEDQQLYNADGPPDQQHFIVTKLQYKYLLHVSIICHVFYKFIL